MTALVCLVYLLGTQSIQFLQGFLVDNLILGCFDFLSTFNQINNVLAFPGIFKGIIKNELKAITDDMKIKSAIKIALFRRFLPRKRGKKGALFGWVWDFRGHFLVTF